MNGMNKGIAFFFAMVLLTGCTANDDYSDLKRGDNTDKAVYEFQKLMDEDKTGDLKAVIWNGEKAYVENDELDDNSISDGRYYRGYEPFANEKVNLNIYDMENRREVISEPDHLLFEDKDGKWFFELQLTDSYENKVEELKQDKWLHFVTEAKLDYDVRKAVFRGVSSYDGNNYAGYTEVYDDGFDNYCVITYMVKGNMNDAGVMINQLVDQLSITFDEDEWIQNKIKENNGDG